MRIFPNADPKYINSSLLETLSASFKRVLYIEAFTLESWHMISAFTRILNKCVIIYFHLNHFNWKIIQFEKKIHFFYKIYSNIVFLVALELILIEINPHSNLLSKSICFCKVSSCYDDILFITLTAIEPFLKCPCSYSIEDKERKIEIGQKRLDVFILENLY
jgi:hypothetical protein